MNDAEIVLLAPMPRASVAIAVTVKTAPDGSPKHVAHAARAELCEDLISPEHVTDHGRFEWRDGARRPLAMARSCRYGAGLEKSKYQVEPTV